jgi:dTMP kinase
VFITFEGSEGAGKTTAIAIVAAHLRELGRSVLVTREPGSGSIGAQVREILLHGDAMPAESELFLFLADRANHVRSVILPALDRGELVLCDRYADSTYVYQAVVRGLDRDFVARANEFATGGLSPNVTFLFDLPPEIGLARLASRDRLDREPIEFHQCVRQGFLALAAASPGTWRVLDATASPESLSGAVLEWLAEHDAGQASLPFEHSS